MRIYACYADRPEPQFGLGPRFEALPKFGKSPNSPGGVTAKAVTPLPQLVNILSASDQFYFEIVLSIVDTKFILKIKRNFIKLEIIIKYDKVPLF